MTYDDLIRAASRARTESELQALLADAYDAHRRAEEAARFAWRFATGGVEQPA